MWGTGPAHRKNLFSGFQLRQCCLERIAVAHLVMTNFFKTSGRRCVSRSLGFLGELKIHGVDLVGLAFDRIVQVVGIAAN